ncbi:NAD(P)H-hydrate dehydratase [Pedosphaera parvula]|uniref:Bifunctional NAD(P)H-hydrate repair enzyme n=1 Tax=Pedosphaera parvula (strain Ellin514) TaxID=320771 RepID=B9XIV0_PEDPL|nr:NAD(P)H-hydrate dehydratase [Pedosphaera parvula]EEF60177.1 carbohydrate kinase, YjeF related protein [Pedosphaera parvula Ellin514]
MPIPVINVAQMREWEKASWEAGKTESEVIMRVGQLVARRASQMVRPGQLVLVLAGKGNNGNDARRAREHLADWPVYLQDVSNPQEGISELHQILDQRPALIIDGLFGIGINRPLDEHWAALIQRINDLQTKVLSIDVPSGLNADTGEPMGTAIRASVTMTLGAPKQGLLLPSAWPYVGRLEVVPDIGLAKCPFTGETNWTLPEDFNNFPPERPATAHKGNFGRIAIIAGSLGYHGAAVLAARGAQRAQPGLITLYTNEEVYHSIAPQLQAVMVSIWNSKLSLPGDFNAVLIGPGLAAGDIPDDMKMMTRHVWRDAAVPVVVDASALDWLPLAPFPKNAIRVITPHPGEASRILRCSAKQVEANRPNALREVSKRLGNCWVVLKGNQTLIGRSSGEIYVNPSGNPYLAQGGSGDALSGYLAGLLAQPTLQVDPLKTLRYAVWQHGATADKLTATRNNWIVEDLLKELGSVVPELQDLPPSKPS